MPNEDLSSPHLVRPLENWLRWLLSVLALVSLALLFCWYEGRLPDQTLSFSREVPSEESFSGVSQRLENVTDWPRWFHLVKNARISKSPDGKIHEGSEILLDVDPGKGARRKFQLEARVTRIERSSARALLELQIDDESSGKIARIVDHLTWRIEVFPESGGTHARILGSESAHTHHWRSRLLGRLFPRTILNQLFYPDLLSLADSLRRKEASEGIM